MIQVFDSIHMGHKMIVDVNIDLKLSFPRVAVIMTGKTIKVIGQR